MSLSSKLVRNSLMAAVGRLWNAGTTIVVMPLMLYILKQDAVGIWFLSNSLLLIFTLADLGVAPALAKYIPEHIARKDREALNRDVNTGILFYLTLGIACVVLGAVFADMYLRFVNTPERIMAQAHVMFLWVTATIGVIVFTNAWRAMLIGVHRMDIINVVEMVVSVPWLIGMIVALKGGFGLPGIAVVQFAQYAAILAALAVMAWRRLPGFRFDPALAGRASFRRLAGFGVKATTANMASVIYIQAEQLIITRLLGPGVLGLYQFGFKITSVFYTVVQPVFNAIVPAASEISVSADKDMVRTLYVRGTKFLLAIVVPGGALLAITAPLTITAWLGAGYGISILALRVLATAAVITVGVGVAKSVARGLARLGPELLAGGAFLATFFALVFPLGHAFGFRGIMAASLTSTIVSALLLISLLHRALGWPLVPDLLRLYALPALVALVAGLPIYWYNHVHRTEIIAMGWQAARVWHLGRLMGVETLLFATAVVVLFRVTRYIRPEELQSLLSAVRGMRRAHEAPTPESRSEPLSTEA